MTEHREHHHNAPGWHGPKAWAVSALGGIAVGWLLSRALPATWAFDQVTPVVPVWLLLPFGVLLASIAVVPFISPRLWHRHYPDVALALGGLVVGYFVCAFGRSGYHGGGSYGMYAIRHAANEYYAFIALVGGLFVVSGGILVEIRGRGSPTVNTAILAFGAVLANLVGTTGASVLLIRPFIRANAGRIAPMHVVLFIFVVSNCGGSLTPIGDPPLYLGYLKGVPFFWTVQHLWLDWLVVNGLLLGSFWVYDSHVGQQLKLKGIHPESSHHQDEKAGVSVRGLVAIVCMVLLVAGVFITPLIERYAPSYAAWPIGPTVQVLIAVGAYFLSPTTIRDANEFNFEPIKEVGLLFAGIFLTMTPALAYLAVHGKELGLITATSFYVGTGTLSAVLDNAPTYLNFLQIAVGQDLERESVRDFIAGETGPRMLHAISTAAVLFGAMTYIGNGPNFMVKVIAERSGVRMPSFFGYLMLACLVLLPALLMHWILFIR